jgi:hypothetical protein
MYGINLTMRVINQILNELNKYDNPWYLVLSSL